MVEDAVHEALQDDKNAAWANWSVKYPHLCLIHSLIDGDDNKCRYHNCHDVPSWRMAAENQNTTESKVASVWSKLTNKWNIPNFCPVTAFLPDTYPNFEHPILLLHESLSHMHPATTDYCNAHNHKDHFLPKNLTVFLSFALVLHRIWWKTIALRFCS